MQKITLSFLVSCIILFSQFEFFGFGPITVVRCLILPFTLCYIIMVRKIVVPISFPVVCCFSFCFIEMISGVVNGEISFFISSLVHALLLIVFVDYLTRKGGFTLVNWLMFASYDLACIGCFIFTYSGFNIANRFKGIYWDPNVMTVYILISMTAKLILLCEYKLSLLKKILFLFLVLMDIILVFSSISRAGILSLVLVLLILSYQYYKVFFVILLSTFSSIMGYMYLISRNLEWSIYLSPIELLSFRIFTSSEMEINNASDESRSGRMQDFWDAVARNDISIIGNGTSYLPDGSYVHNGFLEFFLAVGLPVAFIFTIVLLYLIIKNIVIPVLRNRGDVAVIFVTIFFVDAVFYSYLAFKSFWIFVAYLLFLNYKNNQLKRRDGYSMRI